MRKYLPYVCIALLGLLALVALSAFYGWQHRYEYARLWVTPPSTEEVAEIPTVKSEECVQIIHMDKPKAIKKDMVPEYAKQDPDKQVTAAIDVPAHEAETLVTSVFDMKTGINTLSYRHEPVPFWSLPAWVDELGVRSNEIWGGSHSEVYGRYTLLRMGRLYLAAYGEINTRPDAIILAEVSYRRRR